MSKKSREERLEEVLCPLAGPQVSTVAMRRYRGLEVRLREARSWRSAGSLEGPPTLGELPILEEMADWWYYLTDEEKHQLEGEGSGNP